MRVALRDRSPRSFAFSGVVLMLALALAVAAFAPGSGRASSHREAPLVAADPQVDNTDLYAFVSPDDPSSVTFVSNWIPFEEPAGGPNFYPFAPKVRYDINIDNNGDNKPDVTYRWVFKNHYRNRNTFLYNTGQVTSLGDENLNFYQTYTLSEVRPGRSARILLKDAIAAPSDTGAAGMPDYAALSNEAIRTLPGGGKAWAGQADDPFFLDLRVFDLLYGGDFSEVGDDSLAGFNVNALAVQVPSDTVAKAGDADANPVIGVWSTASRRSTRVESSNGTQKYSKRFVQVSRLDLPLVNEVVVPVSLKDYWNASKPKNDAQFLGAVNDPELPHLIEAVYGIPAPDSNPNEAGIQRDDLIQVALTGIGGLNAIPGAAPGALLRLNLGITPCNEGTAGCIHSDLGVLGGDTSGFPNGRRLADDIIDAMLQVVEGELIGNPNDLADGVNANDVSFRTTFPYVALPHRGSDADPHN